MDRLYAAYYGSGVASVDLGAAVMRQAGFIDKMSAMGWLDGARFERDGSGGGGGGDAVFLLQKAAARYHAFLDLLSTMPAGSLCPSKSPPQPFPLGTRKLGADRYLSGDGCAALDIDLAWHTHQLKGEQYR